MTRDELNRLSNKIIGLCIEIHKNLGPGFLEKIYAQALKYELEKNKINFTREEPIKIKYKDVELGEQRIDFLIEKELILELKSTTEINTAHLAQLLSYLKVAGKKLGLLLNFAKSKLEIKRIVNNL